MLALSQEQSYGERIRIRDLGRLTPDQEKAQRLLRGSQTHTCLVGGSRSGKTTLLVRTIITRALLAAGSRHLIARFRANAVNASIRLDTFKKVKKLWFPGLVTERRAEGYEEFENGSEVWFGGLDEADRIEKILGLEFATIYGGEVSQIPYSSILTMRTRLAQVVHYKSARGEDKILKLRGYYDLNPTSTMHWSNLEFGDKVDPISKVALPDPENFARMFLNPEGNAANLDPSYLKSLQNMPKQFRERFYEGKYVVDVEGALWTASLLELCREDPIVPDPSGRRLADFQRIVVGVDPSGAHSKFDIKSDQIGIVCAGKRHRNTATVLEDASMRGGPKEWGRAAVACYKRWRADAIVAEANYGGAMVESTIKAVDPNVPVILVNASRGKVVRAEPVAALYEEKKVTHAGQFPQLEEQLCMFSNFGYKGDRSPDHADAAVWALTSLMLGEISTYTLEHVR